MYHKNQFHHQINKIPTTKYVNSSCPELLTHYETNKIYAIAFNYDNKRYLFSNEDGHEVIYDGGRKIRQMKKREFTDIKNKMLQTATNTYNTNEILVEIENLDFSLGHANSSFSVITDYGTTPRIKFLVINMGIMRYVYNPDNNSVFALNRDKKTGDYMLECPEKSQIIDKINSSKTMAKKIATVTKN